MFLSDYFSYNLPLNERFYYYLAGIMTGIGFMMKSFATFQIPIVIVAYSFIISRREFIINKWLMTGFLTGFILSAPITSFIKENAEEKQKRLLAMGLLLFLIPGLWTVVDKNRTLDCNQEVESLSLSTKNIARSVMFCIFTKFRRLWEILFYSERSFEVIDEIG